MSLTVGKLRDLLKDFPAETPVHYEDPHFSGKFDCADPEEHSFFYLNGVLYISIPITGDLE